MTTRPKPAPDAAWNRSFCTGLPEEKQAASLGDLGFFGECRFHQTAPATCEARGDDFYVAINRPLAQGRAFWFSLNVEKFHGAGQYAGTAQLHAIVKDGPTIYRWGNWRGTVSLGRFEGVGGASGRFIVPPTNDPNIAAVSFPPMTLGPEPGSSTSGNIGLGGTIECVAPTSPRDNRPWMP